MNSELKRAVFAPFRPAFWKGHSFPGLLREARVAAAAGFGPWLLARRAYKFAGYYDNEQWYRELAQLLKVLAKSPPRSVLEIGVAQGASMFAWAHASAPEACLIGLDAFHVKTRSSVGDLQTAEEVRAHILAAGVLKPSQNLFLVSGDSHSDAAKRSVLDILQGRKLDFLFIDGDHSYEGVWQDFRDYGPLVREGGIIAFHDIVPDFKTRYGLETSNWAGGVHQFWSEVCRQYPGVSIIDRPDQDGFGIGVLHYRQV
jgi:predicted O-methyltransferase YrrM